MSECVNCQNFTLDEGWKWVKCTKGLLEYSEKKQNKKKKFRSMFQLEKKLNHRDPKDDRPYINEYERKKEIQNRALGDLKVNCLEYKEA